MEAGLTPVKAPHAGWMQTGAMNHPKVVTIDVRPDIESGHEPFNRIMRAVSSLTPGQKLLLLAPFEPVPLYRVMVSQGFSHVGEQAPSGHWEILFERDEANVPATITAVAPDDCPGLRKKPCCIEIDARGLEPPMPMVRILEAIETLPDETAIIAHTDRRPAFLLEELPNRGFSGETKQAPDGSYVTHIQRA
jgi:uncharacterized protein (DUF2249 family)